ncbi:hypothetical protein [Promicromonospora sp. AC04]|uniref:hypothetical protein n=1 Tax=Promicromonospora sp. AC04 TaxID=2135723 RepID=UPI000D377E75|nr:hypothetical protein [Promicromonospora sp. AC04]
MFAGYSQDYEPVATPAELASQSTLVVEGEISTVTDGRTWGSATDDPGANQSVVLNVAISEIHVGSAPEGSGDTVYVEVPSPGNVAFDAYASALPDGLTGVFYLIPAAMDTTDILDPDAGRPAGQPLFQMASPQGLVLGSSDGVLQLIEGDEYPEADLRDFIPESERFPVDPDTTPEPDVPAN